MQPRLSFTQTLDDATRRILVESIDLHNVATSGQADYAPFAYLLHEGEELIGGIAGFMWGGWLQVQALWVAPHARRGGHASTLLAEAEAYAAARGCGHATLETHNPTALAFYQRRGYAVFGALADYPPGGAKSFLRKTLGAA